jgi:hypothetical protein
MRVEKGQKSSKIGIIPGSLPGISFQFLSLGNFHPDPEIFNPKLKEWIIEFDFKRPHEALGYKTPIEFACGKPALDKNYINIYIINALPYGKAGFDPGSDRSSSWLFSCLNQTKI